jgi:membrane protein implicated in regulation of membrane protease activity
MGSALGLAGTGVAAALCCLAIPLTPGIIGLSDLAAFGANLGFVAIIASTLIVAWLVRARSRDEAETPRDRIDEG